MSKLLKVIELNKDGNTDVPVLCVCYHPIADERLRKGEDVKPMFCAAEYEYESLREYKPKD